MAERMRVGFIGLGNIGKPMARNLIGDEFELCVYDIAEASVLELVDQGARAAHSPAELAQSCEIVCVCVRNEFEVEQVLYGEGGLVVNARAGSVIAIHSTVTQQAILRWGADAKAHGLDLVDAPITGGAAGASARALCTMLGGESEVLERCRPVFERFGEKIIHAGKLGSGIALKLCNNLMSYAAFVAIHEAANLARACGLSVDLLREVGESNGVVTPQMWQFLSNRNGLFEQLPIEQGERVFAPFAALGEKDLAAALATAGALGLEMPGAEKIRELIRAVFLKRY